jgi:hypothetical protein
MVTEKTYTKDDFNYAIREGIDTLIPITLPFIEIKRGQYKFTIDDTEYELYQGTYSKILYSSRGGQYFQDQKCWGIKVLKGDDKDGLETSPNEFTGKTKSDLIMHTNDALKRRIYKVRDEKGITPPECLEYKDFEEHFKELSDADKVKVLELQIKGIVDSGLEKYDALAWAFDYRYVEGKYIHEDFFRERQRKHWGQIFSKKSKKD